MVKITIFILLAVASLGVAEELSRANDLQSQMGQELPLWIYQHRSGTNITEPQYDASNKQQNPDNNPSSLNNQPSPSSHTQSAQPSSQNVDEQREREEINIQRQLARLTGGLVIVGAIQAGIILFQLFYGARSANASKKSADIAKTTLELTQRAFVIAEQWKLRVDIMHQVTGLICSLRNTGHTHATLGVGSLHSTTGQEMPLPPDPEKLPPTREGPFTIAPHETLEYPFPLIHDEWQKVCPPARSHEVLYFYGYITYTDAFEKLHHVMFCVHCEHPALKPVPVDESGYNYST